MKDSTKKWQDELEARVRFNSAIALEEHQRRVERLRQVLLRAEQFSYLPYDRALVRLHKEQSFLIRNQMEYLRVRSFANACLSDAKVLPSHITAEEAAGALKVSNDFLAMNELCLECVGEALEFVESGDAAELFTESSDGSTLEITAETLWELWCIDPTFNCLRYIAKLIARSRRETVTALKQHKQRLKEKRNV
jgi:hypothetical protein